MGKKIKRGIRSLSLKTPSTELGTIKVLNIIIIDFYDYIN